MTYKNFNLDVDKTGEIPERVGHYELEFLRFGETTRIGKQFVSYPFHMTRPFALYRNIPFLSTVYQQSSSGGMYRGDRLYSKIKLFDSAFAQVTTQAATMVQNCYGKPVRQFLEINTSNNCFFAYTPDVLVMLPGSAVISDTTISRGQGSVILFIDAFDTFDLGQKGQVFDMISAKTKIFGPKEDLVALDCFHITGRSLLEANSPIGSWRTVINCLLLGDLETLPSQEVLEACGITTQDCIIGVSNLPNGAGLCLRVLCKSSIAAKLVMNQIFSKCIVHLTGYYPEPRKK